MPGARPTFLQKQNDRSRRFFTWRYVLPNGMFNLTLYRVLSLGLNGSRQITNFHFQTVMKPPRREKIATGFLHTTEVTRTTFLFLYAALPNSLVAVLFPKQLRPYGRYTA
jgi:hypothetical protein